MRKKNCFKPQNKKWSNKTVLNSQSNFVETTADKNSKVRPALRQSRYIPVNSNTTGTITPMFSSYDRKKSNLKQKAGAAREKWLVRNDWGKLRGVKSLFLSKNIHEK